MHDDKKLNFAVSCTFTQLHGRVHRMTMYVHCIAYIYAKNRFFQETIRDIHRVLQTIQMKLILLCVWAEQAILGSTKTALKFTYEIQIGYHTYNSMHGAGYKLDR